MEEKATLTIPTELYERIERLAAVREESVAYVLEEALALVENRSRDWEVSEAMRREEAAYRAMHAELYEKYAGQYVAVFQGKLVDVDPDEMALYFRIDERFPDDVVLMKQVREVPEPVLHFRSPRFYREQ